MKEELFVVARVRTTVGAEIFNPKKKKKKNILFSSDVLVLVLPSSGLPHETGNKFCYTHMCVILSVKQNKQTRTLEREISFILYNFFLFLFTNYYLVESCENGTSSKTFNFDFSYSSLSSQLSLSRRSLAAAAFLLSPLLPILSQTRPTKKFSSLTHVLLDSSAAASRRSSL